MPRSRSGYSRGPRRSTAWAIGPNSVQQTLSVSGSTIWSNGIVLVNEPLVTVVRIRGYFRALLTAATAAGDGFLGACGIGVVNENAFTVGGTTSVPTPITDADWDGWMWHQFFDLRSNVAGVGDGQPGVSLGFDIDSKSMRKLGDEQVLMGCLEVVEAGTAIMELTADCRLLLKLP